ncbi:mechanosensitive ion channel family protein [Solibacillus sp. FSL H8-0538]|uniref:mechanosensitive ion channel family protein n=1 Tax=Solibacillus sp. FSL H8-0538 TaxID=2921400 RepID=UPI0030FB2502
METEQLELDLGTTDLKGLARFTQKFWDFITSEELWDFIMVATIKIIAILVLSWLVVIVGKKIIANVFSLRTHSPLNYSERRHKTILKLLQSVLSYLVYFSAIMAVLSVLNIEIAGLLAGAGIAGLAIGFGAQSLVKDVITGFFIIFEDQFGVGDYIKLNTAEGTVLEIGLRTTKIKGNTGEQFIIPNGLITDVINYSINNSKIMVDMQVSLDADIEKVEKIIQNYLETLPEKYSELVGAPKFLGVANTTGTEATIRITVETLPLQQLGISRIIRRDVIDILAKNGIPLAYPKMMFYDRNQGGEE